ncbi:ECs_2282 family putative zinc-binding protein [Pseudomonas sp. NY15374]|uniref:ECs_2282 family putative zinc-binding protein n=1 Tax=Pseudomonas sp. NY15374 TaxID=3400357 RepID=UPI003A8A85E7
MPVSDLGTISVSCPQCGATQFIQSLQDPIESDRLKCTGCGTVYTGDELANQFVRTDEANAAIEKKVSDAADELIKKLFR